MTTKKSLGLYAEINSAAYNLGKNAVTDALQGCRIWTSEMHTYIGYSNGKPVSTAATVANQVLSFSRL